MRIDPTYVKERQAAGDACPCVYTKPCHKYCTCVVPVSSKGCRRCCKYGNAVQRANRAERLAAAIDLGDVERPMT